MEKKFTVLKKAIFMFSCLLSFLGLTFAQTTYTFSNYPAGEQYAIDEVHVLDDDVTLYTNECHFTQQLRVYSNSSHNGYFYTNALPLYIDSLAFNMGYNVDVVNIYGSTDGNTWTQVGSISVTSTSYNDYGLSFGANNYNFFKFDVDGNKQIRVVSMTLFYKSFGPSGNAAQTPTFTPEPGFYNSPISVSISSTTANNSIYYTTDGTTPTTSSTLYTAPITLSQTTTVKAIATAPGYANSMVTSATYTFPTVVADLAAFKDLPVSSQPIIIGNDVTFVFGSGAYTYVKDASAGLLLYGDSGIADDFTEGEQVANLMGTRTVYQNQIEMSVSSYENSTAASTGPVIPTTLTISELKSNYTAYDAQLLTFENVTFPNGYTGATTQFVQGTDTLTLFNRFGADTTLAAGSTVNLTGFAAKYGSIIQIYPRNNQDFVAQAPVLTPSITINEPLNGAVYSTLDTMHVNIDIQNFTLNVDGYLKVESDFITYFMGMNTLYLDQALMSIIPMFPLTPLPAGNFTFTASLVDLDSNAISPAVSVSAAFSVVAPVLDAPVIAATGENAGADNTFYFNSTVTLTAAEGASIYYTTDGSTPTEASTLYTAPFQITETATIKAIAVMENYQNSDVATLTVTITAPTVATPVFAPVTGTYADSVTFSLACATDNAVIRYTTDGTEPTEASTLYSAPITLTATTTVKAKAFKTDWFASETATAVYTVVFDPVLTVDVTALNFTSTQLTQTFTVSGAHLDNAISLTCSDAHFTLSPTVITNPNSNTAVTVTFDGTEPATGTVSVASGTLSAQVALTATAQLPAPVLTPATGEDTLITVTMSCTLAGAEVRYTTDGSEPTATSTLYTSPIVLNFPGTYTLKAIAVKTGWENSDITTGTYVINEPPAPDTVNVPVITPATDIYYAPQTVTITCADENAVIRYTADGTEPTEASTIYTAPFTVTTNTTVTAKAWKAGMVPSGTATVTISFPDQVANIAAFKAAAATGVEKQIMSDVTFVFRSGRFMYVEDNSAALLIYDYSTPVITTQYNEGDVIQGGIFGKYTLYQGMVEMLPTHEAAPATGTPVTVTPTTTTVTDIKAQYANVYEAKLVHLNDVQFISATQFVQNGDTMAIYNRFNTLTTTISAGDQADVTGFVSYSSNHGYQIYPRDNNDINIHPVVVMDTVATPEFNFYRSGEFYFMNLTCATEGASIYYTIDNTDPDENSYEFTSDVPFHLNVHYYFKAIAMKEGMVNSEIAVYDYDPTGLPTIDMDDFLIAYPNPASDRVFVHFESKSVNIEKVELYNAYGQLVKVVDVNSAVAEVSVSTLATGTYFAKVFTELGSTTMPVIRK